MNRAKLLQLAASLATTRQLGNHSSGLTQVTRFSQLTAATQPSPFSSTINPHVVSFKQFNLYSRSFSTSNSKDFDELISSNDWSEEFEAELEKLFPKLTHEFVVYCFMKLIKNPKKSLGFYEWVRVRKGFDPIYVPYTLLLKSLLCKGFENDFSKILSEMHKKGFHRGTSIFMLIDKLRDGLGEFEVAKYVEYLISKSDWSKEAKAKAELKNKITYPLSENYVLRVLWEVRKQKWEYFVQWSGSKGVYEHDSFVEYSGILGIMTSRESMREFWEVFNRMKAEGLSYDKDFKSLVKIFRRILLSEDVTLFEEMMDGPSKPSLDECNLLLKKISRFPDADLAYRVMNKCVAKGYTLSKKFYDDMRRILCNVGKFDEAKKIVEEMRNAGYTLSKEYYDDMRRIFRKVGKFDEAKKIVEEMRNAGYEPDNLTYSLEVYDLCVEKRLKEARDMIDHMEEEGCVPDINTWNMLLSGCRAADQMDEALTYFSEMIGKNINPDAKTFEVMLYGFLNKNKLLGAYKFLLEMVDKFNEKPSYEMCKLMIEKLAEVEKIEEALEVLSRGTYAIYPPFCDLIIQCISKSGTVDDADKFVTVMSSKCSNWSKLSYIDVVKSFIEKGREAEARDLICGSPAQYDGAIRYLFRFHKRDSNKRGSNKRGSNKRA